MFTKKETNSSNLRHQKIVEELTKLAKSNNEAGRTYKEALSLTKKRNYQAALKLLKPIEESEFYFTSKSIVRAVSNLRKEVNFKLFQKASSVIPQQTPLSIEDRLNNPQEIESARDFLEIHFTSSYDDDDVDLLFSWNEALKFGHKVKGTQDIPRDLKQLEHVLLIINFLLKYRGKKGFVAPVDIELDEFHTKVLENWGITSARELLLQMCQTLYHLSDDTLNKYNKLFIPAPFTWITFEQFGGFMGEDSREKFLLINTEYLCSISSSDEEKKKSYFSALNRLTNELAHNGDILVHALPDIIEKDLPILKECIEKMRAELNTKRPDSLIQPVSLLNIQALTQRLIDTNTYTNVLSLLTFLYQSIDKARNSKPRIDEYKDTFLYLSSKVGRHAALRYLQKLGEYLTGKNFYSFYNETVSWEDLVSLRNIIVHQDQDSNKYVVDLLLQDPNQLKQIFKAELKELIILLLDNLLLREQKTSVLEGNPQEHWSNIYNAQEKKALEQFASSQAKRNVTTLLTSKEDEEFFIGFLKKKNAPQEIEDLWCKILRGEEKSPLTTKEEGQFRQTYFPTKKEDLQSFTRLSQIMRNALSPPKLKKSQREEMLRKIQEEAKQREIEKKNKVKGLDTIRSIVESAIKIQDEGHTLSPLDRINAAIEALDNMREFLTEDLSILLNYPLQKHGEILALRLLAKPILRAALEYNFGQLVQHLQNIRQLHAYPKTSFLEKNYSNLKRLRNYVEHDNAIMMSAVSSESDSPIINRTIFDSQTLCPMYISLLNELAPELQLIKKRIAPPPKENKAATFGYIYQQPVSRPCTTTQTLFFFNPINTTNVNNTRKREEKEQEKEKEKSYNF
ncbi:hypothetical protein DGG96_17725 [Legionella qingyii]|uniref:Uncharacterized protein n=1 Tax=Legionella qingyii TaxID=2184757 RepID=A0A317U1N6_9GAMM|nr:hypothetical protein [Legionella qingyii]PWY54290.1 hypothetical protein DGG96_17725 [Legionella qingyii]RUR23576.1 hypothetical protein ELY16_13000 [Legionella qingyii]RUR24055.1 hypothetical protein ELY20_05680 [Legionella qingyii]